MHRERRERDRETQREREREIGRVCVDCREIERAFICREIAGLCRYREIEEEYQELLMCGLG